MRRHTKGHIGNKRSLKGTKVYLSVLRILVRKIYIHVKFQINCLNISSGIEYLIITASNNKLGWLSLDFLRGIKILRAY